MIYAPFWSGPFQSMGRFGRFSTVAPGCQEKIYLGLLKESERSSCSATVSAELDIQIICRTVNTGRVGSLKLKLQFRWINRYRYMQVLEQFKADSLHITYIHTYIREVITRNA